MTPKKNIWETTLALLLLIFILLAYHFFSLFSNPIGP